MQASTRSVCALLLAIVCLPLMAAGNDCPAIRSLSANDVQTGEPVTINWSYSGGAPVSQTLTGHDFAEPVALAPGQTSYTYTPAMPGEKHVTLAASSACGMVTQTAKYHVKQCNVVPPSMTVSTTSVAPGDVFQASVALLPGHTARWEVTNGTASAASGESVTVTAGGAGTVTVRAFVSRGSSCSVVVTSTVQVVAACAITEPEMWHPMTAFANDWFSIFLPGFEDPAHPLKATFNVIGGTDVYTDPAYVGFITPASGSFTVEITVTNGTCSRMFAKTFTVENCEAAVVVKPGQPAECGGYATAVAEFSGTPPFQGYWSDWQYFFTYETRIERPIGAGTHTISYMFDRTGCLASVTGSVDGGTTLSPPWFQIDPYVNGSYTLDACPGALRSARIEYPAPGAAVEWSVTNGTIVSGQGTNEVKFTPDAPGTTSVSARFVDANGCPSASYTASQPLRVYGKPEFTITVDPPVIPEGGTAVVTINYERPEWATSTSYYTSLGDWLTYIGNNKLEYRSTHGPGVSTITITASNSCGQSTTHTATLTIESTAPPGPAAKVSANGSRCGEYYASVQFTGTAPFSGTWSNGETFETPNPFLVLGIQEPGTYTLTSFSDATGPGTVTGSATFDFAVLPKPAFTVDTASVCREGIVTPTLSTPLPEGVTPTWYAMNGLVVSGQGTASPQIRMFDSGSIWVGYSGTNACSPFSEPQWLTVKTAQIPYFTAHPVYEGNSTTFDVRLDPDTATWAFENSLGDLIEIVENPQPNYYVLRYTSTHGAGTSTIRIHGTTTCGESFEWSQVMQILPPPPTVALTYTANAACGNDVTATFTGGTAPYSGTWYDGTPFTTSTNSVSRHFNNNTGWVGLYGTDASGNWIDSGSVQVPTTWLYKELTAPSSFCSNTTATVTADLPAGWSVEWNAYDGARIVSGQGTGAIVIEAPTPGSKWINAYFTSPEGCQYFGGTSVYVYEYDGANPVISLPVTTVQAGQSFDFTIEFPNNAYEYLRFENSHGGWIEHRNQRGFTFDVTFHAMEAVGPVTIRAYAKTLCGKEIESTATLDITP